MTREGDGHTYRKVYCIDDKCRTISKIDTFAEQVKIAVGSFLSDVEYQGKTEIGHEEIKYETFSMTTVNDRERNCLDLILQVETRSVPATHIELIGNYAILRRET